MFWFWVLVGYGFGYFENVGYVGCVVDGVVVDVVVGFIFMFV